ncbi:MAG: glycosyltransferase family A protein [Pirellulaceae bacterium]|nr:glycosyltransferase family A protein [Pirellulaceae bacterium]
MLSVILPVRNAPTFAANTLSSLASTFKNLGASELVEFILIDDHSDAEYGIIELFRGFRSVTDSKVKIVCFNQRCFYTYACAIGFTLAKGSQLLFISHDMVTTPSYVKTLLQVASLDDSYGIVRGAS